jgi:glutathione peroxidase
MGGKSKIDFAAFKGKKILIVNTAALDSNAKQYEELKQINEYYKDSLVIVVIPSNSFNSEKSNAADLANFYRQDSKKPFPVANPVSVKGGTINALYQWLTQQTQNKQLSSEVLSPFQKYLINRNGELVGIYSVVIRPNDDILRNGIIASN